MRLVKDGTDPRGCVCGAGQVGRNPGSPSCWEFLEKLSKGSWQGMRTAAFFILPSPQSSPKASPFPKATGSDISLPLILNSPVLTSSSSWAFLWLRQLPGTLLFCLLGLLSPQTFAKLTPSYTNVPSSGKASSGHSI